MKNLKIYYKKKQKKHTKKTKKKISPRAPFNSNEYLMNIHHRNIKFSNNKEKRMNYRTSGNEECDQFIKEYENFDFNGSWLSKD